MLRPARPPATSAGFAPRRVLAAALALLLAAGCAETVKSRSLPALADRPPIRTLAVVPLGVTGALARQAQTDDENARIATDVVGRFLAQGFVRRGISVVGPSEVALTLGLTGRLEERPVPRDVARRLHRAYGADAIVMGEVSRYRERSGHAAGSLTAASVGFAVRVYGAPGGEPLWTGQFEETQQALGSNVFNAARYPGGGTRWLSAEELARWGAQETAKTVPLGR